MTSQTSRVEGNTSWRKAALVLEAMRLGVVPDGDLDVYTVGRGLELEILARDLHLTADAGGAARAFLGDYGTGKTHLLEIAQGRALDANFLCAKAVLDPHETAPSHPMRVYRSVVRSLRYPDMPEVVSPGLGPLLDRVLESPEATAAFQVASSRRARDLLENGAHLYLTPALAYRQASADDPDARAALTAWIEGHPVGSSTALDRQLGRALGHHGKIYSLKDYRPWARIYAYLLSGIAAMARAVGYAGLVVQFDEAEFYSLLSKENRAHALNLFQALTWAAAGRGGEADLAFDTNDVGLGGSGVLRTLPAAYSQDSGLYVIFAMTPNAEGQQLLTQTVPRAAISELNSLGLPHYEELVRKVCEFYVSRYPDTPLPVAVVPALGKVVAGLVGSGEVENPRQAMKFILELLDVVRHHPGELVGVIRGLQSRTVF